MSTTASMAHVCSGPGCTFPGSIAPDTRGKGPWMCWWHFRAFTAHDSLYDVTDAINRGSIDVDAPLGCLWADENRHLIKARTQPDLDARAHDFSGAR